METNEELLTRYNRIKTHHENMMRQVDKMQLGSSARERRARWAGSLYFTLLQIEDEMRKRGMKR
jgi:hypothetical protein